MLFPGKRWLSINCLQLYQVNSRSEALVELQPNDQILITFADYSSSRNFPVKLIVANPVLRTANNKMADIPVRHLCPSPKEPNFSEGFNIRDLRTLLGGADMVQALHRHDFYYILAVEKGAGMHEIDFTSYQVDDRTIFIMRPGQVHKLTLKSGSEGYLMGFKNDFYIPFDTVSKQGLRKATNRIFSHFDASTFRKLLSILGSVFQEYTDKQHGYQEIIKANLGILFVELVRHGDNALSPNNASYQQQRFEEFLELLENHFAGCKQVSQYAEMLNLSVYQLNAITKSVCDKPCSQVISEYVILEAKRYLLATFDQVNQIAYHLGYEDASYFTRFFRKHTGYSPEAFRNNSK